MKKLNKYTNLLNIFEIIIIALSIIIKDFIIYPKTFLFLEVSFYLISAINIILGITNLAGKNLRIGFIQIILGIIMAIGFGISINGEVIIFIFTAIISIVLSIINLVFNKKLEKSGSKALIIFFVIIAIIELGIILVPVIMNNININNLENALEKIKQDEYVKTYTYETDDGKTVFIDENANKIAEKDYTIANYGTTIKIDNKDIPIGFAKNEDGKLLIIDCKGEILFELCPNIFGDENDSYNVASDFFGYIFSKEKFGIQFSDKNLDFDEDKAYEFALYRYQMNNVQEFENDVTSEYMYFWNSGYNSDKVIQIELTNSPYEDTELANTYLDNVKLEDLSASNDINLYNNAYNLIQRFYTHERNYYLINLNSGRRMKLDCENLIYSPYYDESNNLIERILLYTYGEIPFYDSESTGYFDFSGKKYTIQNDYIVQDTSATFNIMLNKTNNRTYAVNKEVEQYILEYPYLKVYNNFYVIYDKNLNQYQILDKNLTFLTTSAEQEPIILGRNLFACAQKNSDGMMQYNSYYFDGTQIKLICSGSSILDEFANKSVDNSDRYDDSIYSKIGIIYISESSDETFVPDTK